MAYPKSIYYRGGIDEVRLGDYVRVRHFIFWKYNGRVVYIPGISKKHPELEYDSRMMVGVRLDEGGFAAFFVDPDTHRLHHSPVLLRRGSIKAQELLPYECLFEDHNDILPEGQLDECGILEQQELERRSKPYDQDI